MSKLEITQISFNDWMAKPTVVHPDNTVLLSNRKEWSITKHHDIRGPQMHYAHREKPHSKFYMLYYSIYRTSRKGKAIIWEGEREKKNKQTSGHRDWGGRRLWLPMGSKRKFVLWGNDSVSWLWWWLHDYMYWSKLTVLRHNKKIVHKFLKYLKNFKKGCHFIKRANP